MANRRNRSGQTRIKRDDLDWVKGTLARLLIENGVLRLVTAHLIVVKCRETEDPHSALRDLHRALDEAAQLVIETEKTASEQRLVEMYQPKIEGFITLAAKLLSPDAHPS